MFAHVVFVVYFSLEWNYVHVPLWLPRGCPFLGCSRLEWNYVHVPHLFLGASPVYFYVARAFALSRERR